MGAGVESEGSVLNMLSEMPVRQISTSGVECQVDTTHSFSLCFSSH